MCQPGLRVIRAQAVKYYNAYAKFTGPKSVECTDKKGKVPPGIIFHPLTFLSHPALTSSSTLCSFLLLLFFLPSFLFFLPSFLVL